MTKEEKKAYDKERYLANKESILAQQKAYKDAHKESISAKYKAYRDIVRNPYRSVVDCPVGMVVHHINHDHSDNRVSNLLVMTVSDHQSYHQFMRFGNYEKASTIIYNYEKEVV